MKLLILSDLNWNTEAREISTSDFDLIKETKSLPSDLRFFKLKEYLKIILDEKADLILFAGDITGDGSCGHGYQEAFKLLLHILEWQKKPSLFIQGNHDVSPYYEEVQELTNQLEHCQEISNQYISIQGLKILGISFESTKNRKILQKLIDEKEQKIDLVIAHSESKRRSALFDFQSEYIITGHYDNKIFATPSSVFLSFANDDFEFINYGTIKIPDQASKKETEVCYSFRNVRDKVHLEFREEVSALKSNQRSSNFILNQESLVDVQQYEEIDLRAVRSAALRNELDLIPHWELIDYPILRYFRGQEFRKLILAMQEFKNDERTELDAEDIVRFLETDITAYHKVSKSILIDYLGEKIRKKLWS